jgi:hypothetical protein
VCCLTLNGRGSTCGQARAEAAHQRRLERAPSQLLNHLNKASSFAELLKRPPDEKILRAVTAVGKKLHDKSRTTSEVSARSLRRLYHQP